MYVPSTGILRTERKTFPTTLDQKFGFIDVKPYSSSKIIESTYQTRYGEN